MISSRVIGGTTLSLSNALRHVIETVFGWMPVNLGYMHFNEQGYNQIGELLNMDIVNNGSKYIHFLLR